MLYIKYESNVVSDKKIFESCILKTYVRLTLWPTYATNRNSLKIFGREPLRENSYKVWSKSAVRSISICIR